MCISVGLTGRCLANWWSSVDAEDPSGGPYRRQGATGQVQFEVFRSSLAPNFPDGAVLRVLGALDMAGAPRLRNAVVSEVGAGTRLVVLDLTGVDHLDSTGLGAVVGALRRLRTHDGELRVVCPEPRVRRVFEVCDLDRVLELHVDVDTALEGMTVQ